MRVSFVGGGTDVNPFMKTFGGEVISCSIGKSVYVTVSENSNEDIVISDLSNGIDKFIPCYTSDKDLPKLLTTGWLSLLPREARTRLKVTIESDAPPGSGLGASSSIAVATCQVAAKIRNESLDPADLAVRGYRLERFFLGFPGGCQDHYAAAYKGFNHFSFKDFDSAKVSPVSVEDEFIRLFLENLTLVWTGVARESASILDDQIAQVRVGSNLKAMHTQKKLVSDFLTGLRNKSLFEVASLLSASWKAKKGFAKSVSNEVLENIYGKCIANGALGGKLLGAGGGGYFLFLCKPEMTESFRNFLHEQNYLHEVITIQENS
jgi:D-glycero-alpha-D-manno-heptose-7-phosphate kinase